jgi:uncharacterized protein
VSATGVEPEARLTVHVQPRAKADQVVGFDEADRLRVRVRAAPNDGAANEAVIGLLAKWLGIHRRAIELERGHTSRTKRIRVLGMNLDQIVRLADPPN